MPPAVLSLVLFGIQELIKNAPGLVAEFQTLFSQTTPPTDADWDALRARVSGKSFDDYMAQAGVAVPIAVTAAPAATPAPALDAGTQRQDEAPPTAAASTPTMNV